MSLDDYKEPTERRSAAESAGQSGDLQGLHRDADSESEGVEELLEEGQAFEAAYVMGVEDAPNADEGGVRTRQMRMDDVPLEYTEDDPGSRDVDSEDELD
ncbi:MAG TPA: hypothetical protein VH351_07185 [Bryobacteraceae bacterium]|jgi:hypothetical protein|nr:hypothetical protein [Bryobacteraceae bacterium]